MHLCMISFSCNATFTSKWIVMSAWAVTHRWSVDMIALRTLNAFVLTCCHLSEKLRIDHGMDSGRFALVRTHIKEWQCCRKPTCTARSLRLSSDFLYNLSSFLQQPPETFTARVRQCSKVCLSGYYNGRVFIFCNINWKTLTNIQKHCFSNDCSICSLGPPVADFGLITQAD